MSGTKLGLGIESSANKLAVGIVSSEGSVMANVRRTYTPTIGSGFLPRETTRHHETYILELIKSALEKAHLTRPSHDIDLICYTKGPGMAGPLSVGATVARTLSQLWGRLRATYLADVQLGIYRCKTKQAQDSGIPDGKLLLLPIVGVNHCVAHIEMGRLICESSNPVVLYVSGGNTQVIAYRDNKYHIFGETLDIAVGNCLDRFARMCNLSNEPSPGYNVELAAQKSRLHSCLQHVQNTDDMPHVLELPYAVKGMDMSFTGILSLIQRYIISFSTDDAIDQRILCRKIMDCCYIFQETIFSMLVEVTERVMAHCGATEVLMVGGVACNARLQEMMRKMVYHRESMVLAHRKGTRSKYISHDMDERYCIDNGCMIAHTGLLHDRSTCDLNSSSNENHSSAAEVESQNDIRQRLERCGIRQRYRTDEVHIPWRSSLNDEQRNGSPASGNK